MEVGHVARTHLEEQHRLVEREMMRLARLAQLALVLLRVAEIRPVRDEPHRAAADFADEALRHRIGHARPECEAPSIAARARSSDVTMMVTMNHEAILMPSGRSKMFTTVV